MVEGSMTKSWLRVPAKTNENAWVASHADVHAWRTPKNVCLGGYDANSIPCGKKFWWVKIFAIFPAIRKNKFPQIKITANIFTAKIYSEVNIL